ncbi:MAG: hypothetical protein DRI44_05680 [Chlamydiae bacterium]|nr:MAG: hypothetical protein DRI44_05680 [Chlamydiota bacterium]
MAKQLGKLETQFFAYSQRKKKKYSKPVILFRSLISLQNLQKEQLAKNGGLLLMNDLVNNSNLFKDAILYT